MLNRLRLHYSLSLAILFFYFLPVASLSFYAKLKMSPEKNWEILTLGLLMSFLGTLFFYLLLLNQKEKPQVPISDSFPTMPDEEICLENSSENPENPNESIHILQQQVEESQQKLVDLLSVSRLKNEEIQKLQNENLKVKQQYENILQEFSNFKKTNQEEQEKQSELLSECQQTITQQRALIEKKHQQTLQLETKVRDLTYEIKTLLQLAEFGNQSGTNEAVENDGGMLFGETPQKYTFELENEEDPHLFSDKKVRCEEEAATQLRRCIDIAQKMTGASHYSRGNSRLRDLAVDNYTLDLRRLFDCLRSENASTVLFYSQKENKLLFVNNQAKNLVGWNPEKFVLDFPEIISSSLEEWKKGIGQLILKNETKISLMMKTKSGSEIQAQAMLGIIPTGIFRNHVIGILYPN